MTGDTTSVLIGLGIITLVLPIGLIVLFRTNRTIEREHPSGAEGQRRLGSAAPGARPSVTVPAQAVPTGPVPTPRGASNRETGDRPTPAPR